MGFWIFMLVMDLMIPFFMLGFGALFRKYSPKEINRVFGYRTSMSMKNQDTWQFAHHYFGKLWYYGGLILLPVTVLAMLPVLGKDTGTVGKYGGTICLVTCVLMCVPILLTEKALKQNFDKQGRRK